MILDRGHRKRREGARQKGKLGQAEVSWIIRIALFSELLSEPKGFRLSSRTAHIYRKTPNKKSKQVENVIPSLAPGSHDIILSRMMMYMDVQYRERLYLQRVGGGIAQSVSKGLEVDEPAVPGCRQEAHLRRLLCCSPSRC